MALTLRKCIVNLILSCVAIVGVKALNSPKLYRSEINIAADHRVPVSAFVQPNGTDYLQFSEIQDNTPNCYTIKNTRVCQRIPKAIPPNITSVIVTSQDQLIKKNAFGNKSWGNVLSLDIRGDKFTMTEGFLFKGLNRLKDIKLNGSRIGRYDRFCFAGLNTVMNLSLAGMEHLDGTSLQMAISNEGVLPNLKYFTIHCSKSFNSVFVKIKNDSIVSLTNRSLHILNMSDIIFEIKVSDLLTLFGNRNLRVLNLTGSFLILDNTTSYDVAVPNIEELSENLLLDTLDSSSSRLSTIEPESCVRNNFRKTVISETSRTHEIMPYFLHVKNWYANYIYPDITEFQGIYNLSSKSVFWEILELMGNNFIVFNATFVLPKNNSLVHLDLSYNNMKYLGRGTFVTGGRLQYLFLSHNCLFEMEYLPEFTKLLDNLENLIVLDLSFNNISFMPLRMFNSNEHLENLNLASNRLVTVTFDLSNLKKLRVLDLRYNQIQYLADHQLHEIQMFVQKVRANTTVGIDVLFQGNPLQCSCESEHFVTWLVEFLSVETTSAEMAQCTYEGQKIDMNENAEAKCKFLCIRPMIVVLSISCSITLILLTMGVTVVILYAKNRKHLRDVRRTFLNSIKAGHYVCFMAVSGKDEDLVNRTILTDLRREFQGMIGFDRELVCTGNRFRPGFAICEESYRLLKLSHVFVAVVSKSFVKSQYCRIELQEACDQEKPIILIFLGQVKTRKKPAYMQEVFRRKSRAWVKLSEDGQYEIIPSIKDIADAIWTLAVASLIENNP